MPSVQKSFEDFHSAIRFEEDDEKATLREKRNTIVTALRDKLGDDVPPFAQFNQGSYSMHTGVVPLDGNFDIDVGLIFDCDKDEYSDPLELKKKVRDAANSNFRTVVIRRPCVTVNYMSDGEIAYHVDLVVYTKGDDGKLYLAKGKENSAEEHRIWEVSDPKELTKRVCSAFDDSSKLAQYRRCIRYLKRWRNFQFQGSGAPLSIALTVAALQWFKPNFAISGKPVDLLAMLDWVNTMLGQFTDEYRDDDGLHPRLKIFLPVAPYSDLMAMRTATQMKNFEEKLEALRDALQKAYDEDLPEDACKHLKKQFGDDFKVPEKSETAKAVSPAVISTGNSA
ncbi:MAG TPA: nucleotidyltransferase [Pseudomonas sabulinigri]|uniref:Nucleotidyltransferase n=1 Tax=marine sediment metagenome TaxID=412755 RepID=A0A0F9VBH6_9ZZZZ|nr:nucleotidyltransferase [Pseudomonas sp. 5Ae-yellow]MBA6420934.1 nucleotidyltransferase [Pseudomonas sp. 5Ae-yellow]HDY99445.1 nucleotidyltransferase [Halopseudomonas sabulinigri]|tara:strand:+ start:1695 stop:2708 length:1014 start_codon:yes stop_codon:yes gene_type:complete